MYDKQKIKETVERLGFEEHIIYTGGSMVMHGLRETTNDLDIGLYEKDFNQLRAGRQTVPGSFTNETSFQLEGDIEVFLIGKTRVPTKTIDNLKCQTMGSVYAWKLAMDRPKDRDDLLSIAEYLLPFDLQ